MSQKCAQIYVLKFYACSARLRYLSNSIKLLFIICASSPIRDLKKGLHHQMLFIIKICIKDTNKFFSVVMVKRFLFQPLSTLNRPFIWR